MSRGRLFHGAEQIGLARVITDKATFAYLSDVYFLEGHRALGLGKRLMRAVQNHPDLRGLRRFMLATADAHSLYAQFGFKELANPSRMMEIVVPDIYSATRTDPTSRTDPTDG